MNFKTVHLFLKTLQRKSDAENTHTIAGIYFCITGI